ncbi:MAG: hypothetical protein RIQ56_489 [Candidatus Parcubacteria bacterium]
MKTIFLVRHGESHANIGTHFAPEDSPLTDKGISQAKFIAERARRLPVDALISSTMGRARETAEYIAQAIGKNIEYSDLVVERKFPARLVGLEKKGEEGKKLWDAWTASCLGQGARVDDGEDFELLKSRALSVISELESRTEENILVVTHGFFMRYLCSCVIYGEALTADTFAPLYYGMRVNNTGLTILHFNPDDEHKPWWVSVWNDHAHLG